MAGVSQKKRSLLCDNSIFRGGVGGGVGRRRRDNKSLGRFHQDSRLMRMETEFYALKPSSKTIRRTARAFTASSSSSSSYSSSKKHETVDPVKLLGTQQDLSSSAVGTAIVDNDPSSHQLDGHDGRTNKRLPQLNFRNYDEFPSLKSSYNDMWIQRRSMVRITKMAIERVLEPPTIHLLGAAACAALTVAAVEGSLLCQNPTSPDSIAFIMRYSIEQLFPSVVWETNDAKLVATAMQLDPETLLRDTSGTTPESASLLLQTQLLQSSRHFWAGFMMIAQFIRAASISFDAVKVYEERIELGQEPPFLLRRPNTKQSFGTISGFADSINTMRTSNASGGLVVRLCGVRSHVSEVSLSKMSTSSFFPVFEDPSLIQFLVKKYSKGYRVPVYWCVAPSTYGASYAWDGFPTDEACFIYGKDTNDKILVLEADATNGNDPLALSEAALDLTIDDASQGFRRILDRYYKKTNMVAGKDFRTLRVYLGNSMEVQSTGGGHNYTLRHRVRYAKEVDVLVDSRAPVLKRVLEWCESVASNDRAIFFQTSSREYFLSLKRLLKQYGYDIYDPLDLRAMKLKLVADNRIDDDEAGIATVDEEDEQQNEKSFLSILLQDEQFIQSHIRDWEEDAMFLHGMMDATKKKTSSKKSDSDVKSTAKKSDGVRILQEERKEMLRSVAKMASLPRLVHMRTTAETVNAVEALVMAGEVNASNCCALIDRQEGVQALERTLRRETRFVQESNQAHQWSLYDTILPNTSNTKTTSSGNDGKDDDDDDEENPDRTVTTGGLHIICSSSIHDNLFRQCRQWARMGYTASEIQAEFDAQYVDLLRQIHTVQQEVKQTTTIESGKTQPTEKRNDGVEESNNSNEKTRETDLIDVH